MCPAFSVQKSRVDEVIKRNDNALRSGPVLGAEAGGIRLPPGMKRESL